MLAVPAPAALITSVDLDYSISHRQSNSYHLDFPGEPLWTAGSQRSENGSVDAGNQRAGRVFVDLQLTQDLIDAANVPGAVGTISFNVLSIGGGVAGTPYTDGLDLRYFGVVEIE